MENCGRKDNPPRLSRRKLMDQTRTQPNTFTMVSMVIQQGVICFGSIQSTNLLLPKDGTLMSKRKASVATPSTSRLRKTTSKAGDARVT